MTVATFGTKEENVKYVNRYRYAVIPNQQRINHPGLQMGLGSYQVVRSEAGEDHFLGTRARTYRRAGTHCDHRRY